MVYARGVGRQYEVDHDHFGRCVVLGLHSPQ